MERIPAAHGRAFPLRAGDTLTVATETGSQVADAWAIAAADPFEHLSMEHTRSCNSTALVEKGSTLYSSKRRAMLTVVEDTSPGRHDTQLCPCSAELYEQLGAPGHRSCTDNFHEALGMMGIALPFTPASLNVFMKVGINPDGTLDRQPPGCAPGDGISFRAEIDVILVLSACPQDITPINGPECTPTDLLVDIVRAA